MTLTDPTPTWRPTLPERAIPDPTADFAWVGPTTGPTVAIMGDSLTCQADGWGAGQLTGPLVAAGCAVWLACQGGMAAYDAADLWRSPGRAGVTPDVLVLALGGKDCIVHPGDSGPLHPPAELRPRLEALVPEVPRVRIVSVADTIDGGSWGWLTTAPPHNAMIAEVAADHPDGAVADWSPDPTWTLDPLDGHLSETGIPHYRDLLVGAALEALGLA